MGCKCATPSDSFFTALGKVCIPKSPSSTHCAFSTFAQHRPICKLQTQVGLLRGSAPIRIRVMSEGRHYAPPGGPRSTPRGLAAEPALALGTASPPQFPRPEALASAASGNNPRRASIGKPDKINRPPERKVIIVDGRLPAKLSKTRLRLLQGPAPLSSGPLPDRPPARWNWLPALS